MIDPLLSLAFAVQSNQGVYALLLGSGVSRAAQIPTGWEIVLDLVEKLAHVQGEECGNDPAQWYRDKYSEEPDYAKLLNAIAKSPEERQQLLARYFEPNEEEREEGLKQPTAAHRAIAALVAGGHVRVIVTTNFDRLIERAIEEEGITPTVLSTPDATEGALPLVHLVHQRCVVVVKVHGDYLDTRIKNTPDELAEYDQRVNELLDQIMDEFGFVICGWSAQWDPALSAAFDRCKSRRFTTYWAGRGQLSDRAERLMESRAGTLIPIKDADTFFTELAEKVSSLEQLQRPHPLSVAAAAATVKRLLSDDKNLIRLDDLVREETERAYKSLQSVFEFLLGEGDRKEKLETAFSDFCSQLEVLRTISIHGALWGGSQHRRIFALVIQRLASDPQAGKGGYSVQESLRVIPSVMTLYSMGLAAVAGDNIEMLAAILTRPSLDHMGERQQYLTSVQWREVQDWFKLLPGHERHFFAGSEWLFKECRDSLRSVIADDSDYDRLFDRFEILRSLVYVDLKFKSELHQDSPRIWGPPGRFVWKFASGRGYAEGGLFEHIKADKDLEERLTGAGLFDGKAEVFRMAVDKFMECVIEMSGRCC